VILITDNTDPNNTVSDNFEQSRITVSDTFQQPRIMDTFQQPRIMDTQPRIMDKDSTQGHSNRVTHRTLQQRSQRKHISSQHHMVLYFPDKYIQIF